MSMQALESALVNGIAGSMFNPLGRSIPQLIAQQMAEKDLELDTVRLEMIDKLQQRIDQAKANGSTDNDEDVMVYRRMQKKYQSKLS